ncbi:MAG TPA: tetratricopeptide repeat protein [Thermoanaerobaculia bacterium]|nr:tetratricopeptide repeat protein [Thermoanaerobaculia bacterium]
MRRSLALSIISLLLVTGNAFAVGEARMAGKVLDAATKQPIPDAVMKVVAVEGKTFSREMKSKKDGGYAIMVIDGTLRYKFTITAPGYSTYEETIKMTLGDTMKKDFELDKGAGSTSTTEVQLQTAKADPAVSAYNEGATMMNAGDVNGAIAKFNEAVTAKPDLVAGWMALAKANARQKNHQKAIDAAKKALEFDDEDTDMWTVLYQSYTGLGDKTNAAAAQAKMPANANALFNQAARLINEGKDAEAETALKQAVAADAKFAQAFYELGMVYVRSGKSAEAREALTKYLELDPSGKDAPTAKEMLTYLK